MKLLLENWREYLAESPQKLKRIHNLFIKAHIRSPIAFGDRIFFKDHMYNSNGSIKDGREVEDDPVAPHVINRRIKIPTDFYLKKVAGEEGTITEIIYWRPRGGNPHMGFRIKWDNYPDMHLMSFMTAYGRERVSDTTHDIVSMIRLGFEII